MGVPEKRSLTDDVLRECALPAAPMAMPQQILKRQRLLRGAFLRPLLQWFMAR